MRTIIQIDDKEAEELSKLCQEKGWSRAKGIREGIRLLLKKMDTRKDINEVVFGIWKDRGIDGVEYQQKLRAEWDREDANN